ncbi:MAG: ABC transporter ATP-binding protein/permease [Oscillospiraceae bacterium]|nr:ABC transporter ATP-binding protein/permease [Oscillospiraceae bacterium]
MTKLFRICLNKWYIAVLTIAILGFQAYCELELPSITADIVNVGIQQSGIDTPVPEKIEYEQMQNLLLIVNDLWDEAEILEHYTLKDGVYELDEYSPELEELLFEPLAIALFVENMTVESFAVLEDNREAREAVIAIIGEDALELNLANVRGMLEVGEIDYSDPFVRIVLEVVKNKVGDIDPVLLRQSAIMQTREELITANVDVEKRQMNYIYGAGARMLLFALSAMVATVTATVLSARFAAYFSREARRAVFAKVLRFSGKELDTFSTASLITRCTNDVQQMQNVLSFGARMLVFAPIMGLGAFFKVLNGGSGGEMWWVIGIAIGTIFVVVATLFALTVPRFNKMQPLVDRLSLISRETLSGLAVIRTFSREEHEQERFDKANLDLTKVNLFVNRAMAAMFPTMMFVMHAVSVLIVWVGASHIDMGTMQIGDLMAFINYTMQIIMSFLMLTMISVILPRAFVSFRRIAKVLDTEVSVVESEKPSEFGDDFKPEIEFRNVSFKYHNAEEAALSNISFKAAPGETIAVIGSTGSGKSTLAKLLLRFFDTTEGEVLIGGKDIKQVPLKELRKKIAYVPQKASLFSGTIRSNIAYSDDNMSEQRITESARIAQAEEFISNKESGYDEAISQGAANVSGGQKQRISIARAVAQRSGIYVFDDCFSALDFKTDAALRQSLSEKLGDSTMIIIAQRISTVINAGQIIVLEEGRVVGIGKHSDLMENCETYRQIAYSQLSEKELSSGEEGVQ